MIVLPEISRDGFYYLASPYSKHPHGIESAWMSACRIAARLTVAGFDVYSPIAETHPIAVHGGLDPLDYGIWLKRAEKFMRRCDGLIIAKMVGWEVSYGVNWETKWFRENKGVGPVFVDP